MLELGAAPVEGSFSMLREEVSPAEAARRSPNRPAPFAPRSRPRGAARSGPGWRIVAVRQVRPASAADPPRAPPMAARGGAARRPRRSPIGSARRRRPLDAAGRGDPMPMCSPPSASTRTTRRCRCSTSARPAPGDYGPMCATTGRSPAPIRRRPAYFYFTPIAAAYTPRRTLALLRRVDAGGMPMPASTVCTRPAASRA